MNEKKNADWKKMMQGHRGHRRVKWELDQGLKVKVQVYSLISSLQTYHPTLHLTPVRSCAISTTRRAYSPAAVSVHWTYRTHCHPCPARYSFSPESSEAFESELPCQRTQHLNNVPRLRGEKNDISAPSGIWNPTAGGDIGKAPRSNHCAMFLSNYS